MYVCMYEKKRERKGVSKEDDEEEEIEEERCEDCVIGRASSVYGSRTSSSLGSISCHDLEAHSLCKSFNSAAFEPSPKVLALAHIKSFKLMTAFHDGLNPYTSYPHAPSNRQLTKL